MSKFNVYFRCPCCNEPLDDWETSMYDVFEGMKEECHNKSMEALRDLEDNEAVKYEDLDIDLGGS